MRFRGENSVSSRRDSIPTLSMSEIKEQAFSYIPPNSSLNSSTGKNLYGDYGYKAKLKDFITAEHHPACHHQNWDQRAISELNFPSANGFQSPKCYQDNSSNQNTNYLWGTTVNSSTYQLCMQI